MAKTRMKTTPTRMQKDALMASAATTVTVAMAGVEGVRKRLRQSGAPKEPLCATSTIIVAAPKRTNSISSAASSMSHASDTHSAHSDSESPPPPPTATPLPTAAASPSTTPAPRTLNSLLCKPSAAQIGALKNRKVYMITERCEEPGAESGVGNSAAGQKRKMYLIMEENSTDGGEGVEGAVDATKFLKSENGAKKLTLFADKSDVVLTQHFEKILPEILNRIQAKDGHVNAAASASIMRAITTPPPPPPPVTATTATTTTKLHNGAGAAAVASCLDTAGLQPRKDVVADNNNKRLPITLPPKKNRTKIIATHMNNSSCNSNNNDNNSTSSSTGNGNSNNSYNAANSTKNATNFSLPPVQIKQISAATPVIVSTASLPSASAPTFTPTHSGAHIATNNKYTHNGQTSMATATATAQPQKNINLSTDFLFLMKMLPKLESIPEPHKNHVKHYIEKIVTQNANTYASH